MGHPPGKLLAMGTERLADGARLFASLLIGAMLVGCGTLGGGRPGATEAIPAEARIPQEALLDVAIRIFHPPPEGHEASLAYYNPDVLRAEAHYIPYHLKKTLQHTGQWGNVRVVPDTAEAWEIRVEGTLIESTGDALILTVDVKDATGRDWLRKRYRARADRGAYADAVEGLRDPFQDFYDRLADDMLARKRRLAPDELREIRQVSLLKYAGDLAPDAFGGYVAPAGNGRWRSVHPAAHDAPMLARVRRVREREHRLQDSIDAHYGELYAAMWDPYLAWRAAYLDELQAGRALDLRALTHKLLGVAALAGAIANELYGGRNRSHGATGLLVMGGLEAYRSGVRMRHDARIHSDLIQELGDAFGADMTPLVTEVEGHSIRLQGSAEQQYREWQRRLRQIFRAETRQATSPR
jgi:hypothetical protein